MESYIAQLPETIQKHVREVAKTVEIQEGEDPVELVAKVWLEKRRMFEEQTKNLRMEETDVLPSNDPRGALILTYSGSLLSLTTPSGPSRAVEYASIGLRKDVPEIAQKEDAVLSGDVHTNTVVEFKDGPIKKSSPALKIAVCGKNVSEEEQNKRIREATIFLTNGFVKINRTIISPSETAPEQFTMKSMTAYIALKNGISQKFTRQILEDYIHVIETGVLLGAGVPFGKIGKLFLKKRPAQKARVGRNPATGEEITIKAKPETFIPRISFSRHLKERASALRV